MSTESAEAAMHAALAFGGFEDAAEAERVTLWAAEEIARLRDELQKIKVKQIAGEALGK